MVEALPQSEVAAPTAPARRTPQLWNPTVAALWSIPFTPVFGAYIHHRNWLKLGHSELAMESKTWSKILFFLIAVGAGIFIYLPVEHPAQIYLHYLPNALTAGWYLSSGHRQVQYVKAHLGNSYIRISWAGPLLLAFGLYIAWIATFLFIGAVLMELQK